MGAGEWIRHIHKRRKHRVTCNSTSQSSLLCGPKKSPQRVARDLRCVTSLSQNILPPLLEIFLVLQVPSVSNSLRFKKAFTGECVQIPESQDFEPEKKAVSRNRVAALFTIARTWKQPKCPSRDEWIKKIRCTYTVEYYSATKRNKIMPFATTWMDLEIVILSEVSQTQKDKYHMILLICGI